MTDNTKKIQKKKKSKREPSIKQYLTYRRAMKLMNTLKDKYGRHPWSIKYIDDGSSIGSKLEIKYKMRCGSMMTSDELSELLSYIMKLNVRYFIFFHPSMNHILYPESTKEFSIDLDIRD